MTKEEAKNMSSEKIFLHMEARLAAALEETRKKYGKEVADTVQQIINNVMASIFLGGPLPCPQHVVFCAWIETMASWNKQIDDLVRK